MKKSLKKLFLSISVLLLTFFIVACGGKDKLSKKEIIERFIENSKNIKSAEMVMNVKLGENSSTDVLEVNMEALVIMEPLNMKLVMNSLFQNQKMEIYIKDNYIYVLNPFNNQWIKQINEELNEQLKNSLALSNEIYDALKENINKLKLEEKDDSYVIIVPKNTKILENILKKQLSSITIPNKEMLEKIKFEDVHISYTIDKENYLPISAINTFTMVADKDIKTSISIDAQYFNINNIKEIPFPKEAENTEEIKM